MKNTSFLIATWLLLTMTEAATEAQLSVPYSTSGVQGSTIITNYYDPNAGPDVGPGLSPSPLENRFNAPLNQLSPITTSTYGAILPTPGTFGSSLPPISSTGPVYPLGAQSNLAQPYNPPGNYTQNVRGTGIQILNPIPQTREPQLASHVESPTYPYPGLLVNINGKWEGSPYLYNMPQNIGVVIEVVKPGGKDYPVDHVRLRNDVADVFIKAGIQPQSLAIGNDPPLPFFHVLIYIYPGDDIYTAAIAGRLFEKVKLARLDYNLPGTMQAITWEQMNLLITSEAQFDTQLSATLAGIAKAFTDGVAHFNEQALKQNTGFRLQPVGGPNSGSNGCCR